MCLLLLWSCHLVGVIQYFYVVKMLAFFFSLNIESQYLKSCCLVFIFNGFIGQ